MGFPKVWLFIAAIIGCGVFVLFIHETPPARTFPAPPRPHTIRPIPKPVSQDGGIFRDRNVLDHGGEVLGFVGLAGLAAFLFWSGFTEFRDRGEWTAFIPLVALAVIVGGLVSWFGYFIDHGLFLIFPIVVSLVVIALVMVRALVLDRQRREEAAARMQFDKTPVHGYSQEATPDDERRFGL
jgi:hypothetical protein